MEQAIANTAARRAPGTRTLATADFPIVGESDTPARADGSILQVPAPEQPVVRWR